MVKEAAGQSLLLASDEFFFVLVDQSVFICLLLCDHSVTLSAIAFLVSFYLM
jgi:hypothetical protein